MPTTSSSHHETQTRSASARYVLVDIDADRIVDRNVELDAFLELNAMTGEERRRIEAMAVGEDFMMGGGAAVTYSLRREA